MQYYSNKLKII